jgi:hypothetical protein
MTEAQKTLDRYHAVKAINAYLAGDLAAAAFHTSKRPSLQGAPRPYAHTVAA